MAGPPEKALVLKKEGFAYISTLCTFYAKRERKCHTVQVNGEEMSLFSIYSPPLTMLFNVISSVLLLCPSISLQQFLCATTFLT